MKTYSWVLLGSVAAVAVATVWSVTSHSSKASRAARPQREAREEASSERDFAPRVVERVVTQPAVEAVAAPPPPSEREPLEPEEIATELEMHFESVTGRTSESRAMEGKLRDAFTRPTLPSGTNLQSLECRPGTCKAVVTFADIDADKQAISSLFLDPSSAVETGMQLVIPPRDVGPDGVRKATIYLVPPDFVLGG